MVDSFCRCLLSEMVKALCTSELITVFVLDDDVTQHVSIYSYMLDFCTHNDLLFFFWSGGNAVTHILSPGERTGLCGTYLVDYTVCQKYTNSITFSHQVVSAINSSTYNLSHFLTQKLKPLIGKSGTHIINSTDFIQKIRLHPADILMSFDIESFFIQVPIKDTLNIIKSLHEVSSNFIPFVAVTTTAHKIIGRLHIGSPQK